jgi:hypothetical protein
MLFRIVFMLFFPLALAAQPITGVWRGKVQKGRTPFTTTYKLEVKVVRQGDSLTGTSYYYANAQHYYRYAIKGYLDPQDASLHWWDDVLLESKGPKTSFSAVNQQPLAMQTDFNCPGAGIMKLDGVAETKNGDGLEVHLDKMEEPLFADGWDELLANWWYGGADPDLIAAADTEQRQPKATPPAPTAPVIVQTKPAPQPKPRPQPQPEPKPQPAPPVVVAAPPVAEKPQPPTPVVVAPPVVQTIQQKFDSRHRVVQITLPLAGDSVELQFFDNAEIDGDSISLFLNGRLLFEHVRLSALPFVFKLAVQDLPADAELSMVAENLGAIPPNTSFMMAYINGQRYTARLESTEKTTAVIRFRRE